MCDRCAALEAEAERLARQVDRLRHQQERIRRYAELVRQKAGAILCQRSGVPRGKWSFARGADRTAEGVLKLCRK